MNTKYVFESKAKEVAGAKEIRSKASTLPQVLKQLTGLGKERLAKCDNITVDQWFEAHGVDRVTEKGNKRPYTVGDVRKAWPETMLIERRDEKTLKTIKALGYFKTTYLTYTPQKGQPGYGHQKTYKVYTRESALSENPQPMFKYAVTEPKADKWSVDLLLRSLIQTNNIEDELAMQQKCELNYVEADELCIFVERVEGTGEEAKVVRDIVTIDKKNVKF